MMKKGNRMQTFLHMFRCCCFFLGRQYESKTFHSVYCFNLIYLHTKMFEFLGFRRLCLWGGIKKIKKWITHQKQERKKRNHCIISLNLNQLIASITLIHQSLISSWAMSYSWKPISTSIWNYIYFSFHILLGKMLTQGFVRGMCGSPS